MSARRWKLPESGGHYRNRLESTGNYRKQLESTGNYRNQLETTGIEWKRAETTGNYRIRLESVLTRGLYNACSKSSPCAILTCSTTLDSCNMHEAWEIVLTQAPFWQNLDNFKSHVMRGVNKKIKNEFMKLWWLQPILYTRYVTDLREYFSTRRLLKHPKGVSRELRPPRTPWAHPGTRLMVEWTTGQIQEVSWGGRVTGQQCYL